MAKSDLKPPSLPLVFSLFELGSLVVPASGGDWGEENGSLLNHRTDEPALSNYSAERNVSRCRF